MPPEVRRLIERVPVTMDVSHSPRRNSYTEGASRKQNKMLTVGTSLQKHSSDTSLGTRMRIIIVDWNFFMYSKFIYLFHSYAFRLYTCTILQWYCNCYMVYLAIFVCKDIYMYTVYLIDTLNSWIHMFQSAVYNQLMIVINGYLYAYTYANSISIAFTISKHDTHVVNKHLFIHVFSIYVLPYASSISWTANPVSVGSSTSSISQSSTDQVSIHYVVVSKTVIKVNNGKQTLVYNLVIKLKALNLDWRLQLLCD